MIHPTFEKPLLESNKTEKLNLPKGFKPFGKVYFKNLKNHKI